MSFDEYPTWTLSVRVSMSPSAPGLGAILSPKSPKVTFFPFFSSPPPPPARLPWISAEYFHFATGLSLNFVIYGRNFEGVF